MVVYAVPAEDACTAADRERISERWHVRVMVVGDGHWTVKDVVGVLSRADCSRLVLPDDYHRHTADLENVKACARHMGMQHVPLSRFIQSKQPVAAAAVPPSQQTVAAGQPIHTT